MPKRGHSNLSFGAGLVAMALSAGCSPERVPEGEPGAPLTGLSPRELADFAAGSKLFDHEFTPEEGLGPAFNDRRCSSCHDLPVLGGAGADNVRKATRFENSRCDLLVDAGGDLFQSAVTPALAAHGIGAQPIPARANAFAMIAPPPLFGMGAIAAIPDAAIRSRADPDDRNRDGISGRTGRAFNGRLGRFGKKATFATLHDFVTGALSGEMGLTTTAFPQEETLAGRPLPPGVDPHAEPEVNDSAVAQITRFVELLAPVAGLQPIGAAARDSVDRGERLFKGIGCDVCHTPSFTTGRHRLPQLDRRAVPLYSDLLLHDLGPDLASVCAPDASPSEWRTAPLAGVRLRHHFLNQGQALSLEAAIRLHGGEADRSSKRFQVLSPADQAFLIRFLLSL